MKVKVPGGIEKFIGLQGNGTQYSLQLADTVGAKKRSANWKCPPFGKFFNIKLNFENKAFFYIYKA